MPRKCGLCKKEGHNRTNCENAHYKGEYNYKGERHGKGTYEYKLSKYKTALDYLLKALKVKPEEGVILEHLGDVYMNHNLMAKI